ncbi:MAG TPA: decaprenyl-phosphate phosphoribosyltransferase [Chroococcales cyanobacterium]
MKTSGIDLVKLVRPKQWTKNLIAFVPILFAMKIHELPLLLRVSGCFAAFCFASSAIYVLNDVLDRETDRAHPTKKNRPIASGRVSLGAARTVAIGCTIVAILISFLVRPSLVLVIAAYLGLMVCYTLWLKHMVLVDVFCIATGFVLRALGGAVAASIYISNWFLLCTSFGALFLGLEKRRKELQLLKDDAQSHRKTLTSYSVELLDRMESVIVPCLLTCYALYSFQSYHGQNMLITVPFVVFGILRYQYLSVRDMSTGSPEEVLLKDRPIQIAILLWVITSGLVVYGLITPMMQAVTQTMDSYTIFR